MNQQGYKLEFYARTNYVKQITTKSGTPFVVGQLSAFIYAHGYVNISFKSFNEVALKLENKQWIKGYGTLGFNIMDKEQQKLEVIIDSFEFADAPPFQEPTKKPSTTYNKPYQAPQKEVPKPTKDTKDLEAELFGDINEDDLPF